jgi:hypothetical protein
LKKAEGEGDGAEKGCGFCRLAQCDATQSENTSTEFVLHHAIESLAMGWPPEGRDLPDSSCEIQDILLSRVQL